MHLPIWKLTLAAIILFSTGPSRASEITVSAAASLTNAFREVAAAYETRHAGSRIALNFGASGALLQQMAKGAPVDVFASADQETMGIAVAQGIVKSQDVRIFARNALVLVVPADSNLAFGALTDLTQSGVRRIAIGNPASVPAGRYVQHALESAHLWQRVAATAIYTQNVRQSLDYVARGEVDAGFVYASDAALMPGKVKVALAVPLKETIRYPIARTAASDNITEASRFIDFVASPSGQAILVKYGFQRP